MSASRAALRRLSAMPFATAVAVLLVISGATQLFGIGLAAPVDALLPGWEATLLGWLTVAAGALMITGMGTEAARVEMAGLLGLVIVVTSRFLLYGFYLGFGLNFAVTGIFDAAIIWAAVARMVTVARGQVIVRVSGGG